MPGEAATFGACHSKVPAASSEHVEKLSQASHYSYFWRIQVFRGVTGLVLTRYQLIVSINAVEQDEELFHLPDLRAVDGPKAPHCRDAADPWVQTLRVPELSEELCLGVWRAPGTKARVTRFPE